MASERTQTRRAAIVFQQDLRRAWQTLTELANDSHSHPELTEFTATMKEAIRICDQGSRTLRTLLDSI